MSESPFLPETKIQYAWDSTSLGYLKTCPRLYKYIMIDGWSSREESVHLRFGIEYHHALQSYDLSLASGIKHEEALYDVITDTLHRTWGWESDHRKKNRETLIRTIVWYLDKHKDDPNETHILSNGKPAVELSFRFELDYGPADNKPGYGHQNFVLSGHLDKVFTFAGSLYVKDYKTIYSLWGATWEPDNQMTLYTLASKIVLHTPVAGVVIDMATFKKKEGFIYPEFQRAITQRTPDQLEEWLADLKVWLRAAEQYAIEDHWPQNDTSCGKYGGCRFREVCSASPAVRERFLESNFKRLPEEERWNPLKSR